LFCRNTQYIDKKAVILREENLNEENPQEENPKGENPKEENPKEENPTERGYYCCIYQSDTSGSCPASIYDGCSAKGKQKEHGTHRRYYCCM